MVSERLNKGEAILGRCREFILRGAIPKIELLISFWKSRGTVIEGCSGNGDPICGSR